MQNYFELHVKFLFITYISIIFKGSLHAWVSNILHQNKLVILFSHKLYEKNISQINVRSVGKTSLAERQDFILCDLWPQAWHSFSLHQDDLEIRKGLRRVLCVPAVGRGSADTPLRCGSKERAPASCISCGNCYNYSSLKNVGSGANSL